MTRDVITAPPELSLEAAARIMEKWRVRHLPVVQGGKLVGIVSDRDVLLHAEKNGSGKKVPDIFVGEAMSLSPICCQRNTTVSWMAETMIAGKIDAIPVVDAQDRLLGLVTSSDLLFLLIDSDHEKKIIPFDFNLRELDSAGELAAAA